MISLIKTQNLNKYYEKSKETELHVINNTSLELPSVGLVSFIGKSGSGKTTLLNVLGGLDKEDSGTLNYNDELILKKYSMSKIDLYRKKNIGYIFQNYLLLDNKSVYDNLRIALEIIGVLDPEEQKRRIEYVLNAVGLFKYRKKTADKLSGGQMQRVSIARALIKKSRIIIADEPTGNLDSENTIEVMNILKKISEKALVLLVTHNKQMADFYSDRVIELSDGKIIADYNNSLTSSDHALDVKNDRQIYLKDLDKKEIDSEPVHLNVYTDETKNAVLELNIIFKNNTIYIDSPQNIHLVRQTNVELIDAHYKHLEKEEVKEFDFDISWYKNDNKKSNFKLFFKSIKNSFLGFIYSSKKSKVFKGIFFALGIVMAICMISAVSYTSVKDELYSTEDASYIVNKDFDMSYNYYPTANYNLIEKAIKENYIEDIYAYNGFYSSISSKLNSVRSENLQIRTYTYPFSKIKEQTLLCGTSPNSTNIVIGRDFADFIIENMTSISTYEELLNLEIINYKIVGVSSTKTNSIYLEDSFYYMSALSSNTYEPIINTTQIVAHAEYEDYNVVEGRDIESLDEILINEKTSYRYKLGSTILDEEDNKYIVVGYFTNSSSFALTKNWKIVGSICDETIYDVQKYNICLKKEFKDYTIDTTKNSASREINQETECLVNVYSAYSLGETIRRGSQTFTVVGYYKTDNNIESSNLILLEEKPFLLDFYYSIESSKSGLSYSISKENIENVNNLGLQVFTPYNFQKAYDESENSEQRVVMLVIVIVLLIFSMIYVYFSTRSKLISQVREIGVFRSIGANRMYIVRRFIANIFVETSLTSLLGYLITISLYIFVSIKLNSLLGGYVYDINYGMYILGALVLYAINLCFGLIPVLTLMRKTPAEINSKYDI